MEKKISFSIRGVEQPQMKVYLDELAIQLQNKVQQAYGLNYVVDIKKEDYDEERPPYRLDFICRKLLLRRGLKAGFDIEFEWERDKPFVLTVSIFQCSRLLDRISNLVSYFYLLCFPVIGLILVDWKRRFLYLFFVTLGFITFGISPRILGYYRDKDKIDYDSLKYIKDTTQDLIDNNKWFAKGSV